MLYFQEGSRDNIEEVGETGQDTKERMSEAVSLYKRGQMLLEKVVTEVGKEMTVQNRNETISDMKLQLQMELDELKASESELTAQNKYLHDEIERLTKLTEKKTCEIMLIKCLLIKSVLTPIVY